MHLGKAGERQTFAEQFPSHQVLGQPTTAGRILAFKCQLIQTRGIKQRATFTKSERVDFVVGRHREQSADARQIQIFAGVFVQDVGTFASKSRHTSLANFVVVGIDQQDRNPSSLQLCREITHPCVRTRDQDALAAFFGQL